MCNLLKILTLVILTTLLLAQSDLSHKIQDQSTALKQIRAEIESFKKDLEKNKHKEKTLLEELNKTEKQMSLNEKLMNQLTYEIKEKRQQIREHEQTIRDNTEKIADLKRQ